MLPLSSAPVADAPVAGVESDPVAVAAVTGANFSFAPGHFRLMQFVLRDQTDKCAELYDENQWLLHPNETVELRGNAFALENTLDGSGTVFLKLAPLPDARATPGDCDVGARRGGTLELSADIYPWKTATYVGGKWGRIAAFHALQRQIRPYDPDQDGLFLTNTWGDRHRDAHLNPDFMAREIEAGARLGADIVQTDDGW